VTSAVRIAQRPYLLIAAALIVVQGLVLFAMGRVPICACGTVEPWQGVVHSAQNSQQIFDWYSFSHLVHGFLFYGLTWLILRRAPLALRLMVAVMLEVSWEILENSDFIINRYRAETISLDYYGDSIVNSVSDTLTMAFGFALASWVPTRAIIAAAVVLEAGLGILIRDNLVLNVIMLIYPLDVIKAWQATPLLN
jgi:hypothetical protein